MAKLSFDIASGNYQTGGSYSRTRLDNRFNGSGLGRDVLSSIVSAALPKVIGALGEYGTSKISKLIKGEGKGKGKKSVVVHINFIKL